MGTEAGSVKSSKEKRAEKAKEKKSKAKEYLVFKYEALKTDTEKGKKLLASETQGALIYRACSKGPVTFVEILAAISPKLKGKSTETISNNGRWYINSLKKKGFLRHVEEKVQAASQDEARGVEQ